jgi:hypothetical protein
VDKDMPEISRFFGIIIAMYWDEHNPPHFHARYGTFNAAVDIISLKVLEGGLPPRVLGLVIEWASIHKKELLSNWKKARQDKPLKKIEPLQ